MKKTLIIAVAVLCINVLNAQKKYNFAYTIDRGSLDRGGSVFFSPVVSANVEDNRHDLEKFNLKRKWEKKVFTNYTLKTDRFKTHSWVWNSFGKADEKRDKMIANFKRMNYKVHSMYLFGFHYVGLD